MQLSLGLLLAVSLLQKTDGQYDVTAELEDLALNISRNHLRDQNPRCSSTVSTPVQASVQAEHLRWSGRTEGWSSQIRS